MNVCAECLGNDYGLRTFIEKNAESNYRDYCQIEAGHPIAADFDLVMEFVTSCIRLEWTDAVDELGWAHEMGGWIGYAVDSYNLPWEFEELNIENDQLHVDVAGALGDIDWCRTNPYGQTLSESHLSGWQYFSQRVKHSTRYMFFQVQDNQPYRHHDDIQPNKMLYRLAEIVDGNDLLTRLERGGQITRIRIENGTQRFGTATELGPPSIEKAKYSNRMSPAGIPMFYGAFDTDTALKETYTRREEAATASIATFELLKPLTVLDLTRIEPVPSLFDEHRNYLREPIKFLRAFINDISKPIVKDGREHIEYVPTQVFTEYIRYRPGDVSVNGIIYPSAVNPDHASCVLFLENEACCDLTAEPPDNKWLMLTSVEHRSLP